MNRDRIRIVSRDGTRLIEIGTQCHDLISPVFWAQMHKLSATRTDLSNLPPYVREKVEDVRRQDDEIERHKKTYPVVHRQMYGND